MVKTIIRRIFLIICGLVLGVNLYVLNARTLLGNPLPMPFGYGMAIILSGSMEPELSVDDLIIISEQEQYQVGDIVAYQEGRMIVTHRIVSISGNEVITRGDANNVDDEPIVPEQIKGKVILVIPFVGPIVSAIKTPVGTLMLILLIVLWVENSFRMEKKKSQKEMEIIKEEIEKLKQENSND